MVLCTHIKKIIFSKQKSLKYNLKLIYLIINKNINTQLVTQFLIKLKLPRYMKTSSIVKQKQSPKTSSILKQKEYLFWVATNQKVILNRQDGLLRVIKFNCNY